MSRYIRPTVWLTCLCQKNDKSMDATNFGGGIFLPEYSKINPPIYLCVSINSIDAWIQTLEKFIAWRYCAYQDNSK